MKRHYRYGWPMGHWLARMGIPTKIVVDVVRDDEAGVFIGTSRDVRGLVVEASSLEELMQEARTLIPELIQEPSGLGPDTIAESRFRDRIAHA